MATAFATGCERAQKMSGGRVRGNAIHTYQHNHKQDATRTMHTQCTDTRILKQKQKQTSHPQTSTNRHRHKQTQTHRGHCDRVTAYKANTHRAHTRTYVNKYTVSQTHSDCYSCIYTSAPRTLNICPHCVHLCSACSWIRALGSDEDTASQPRASGFTRPQHDHIPSITSPCRPACVRPPREQVHPLQGSTDTARARFAGAATHPRPRQTPRPT